MKDTEDLVSIFVPYYNDRSFLRDCIDSILNQSYEKFELILLDHASTDDSAQVAQSYDDRRIKHVSLLKNLGAGGGVLLNKFLDVAKGNFVKLFCADDVMHVDCIATFVNYMKANPQVDVVFGNIQYVDECLKPLKDDWFNNRQYFNVNDRNSDLLDKLKFCSVLPYIGNFVRRDAFAGVEINQTFILMFDMSLWVEMLLIGREFAFLDKIVANYRLHKNQISSKVNFRKISTGAFYESLAYCDIFYSHAKSLDALKKICVGSPYLDKLGEDDMDLMEFVVAHYFLTGQHGASKTNAYLKLEKMFSDDCLRNKIETKFSYGIAEFRKDYLGAPPTSVSFKKRMYSKCPKDLNMGEIIFLLLRSLWNIVSLKKIKQRYTV